MLCLQLKWHASTVKSKVYVHNGLIVVNQCAIGRQAWSYSFGRQTRLLEYTAKLFATSVTFI